EEDEADELPVQPAKPPNPVKPSANRAAADAGAPANGGRKAQPESQPELAPEVWDGPPPPDAFPADWDDFIASTPLSAPAAVSEPAGVYARGAGKVKASSGARAPELAGGVPQPEAAVKESAATPAAVAIPEIDAPVVELAEAPKPVALTPAPIVEPPHPDGQVDASLASLSDEDRDATYMMRVTLRSTGDKTRDVLRLRRIHGIITSYPGRDRFGFQVFEQGRGYLLEFPNFTAGITPELVTRLKALVGPENVNVEPITFL
ncbi:MAG TPA: hypothetical protein VLS48_00845, partial [Anaerolineales bacterium]|nr:hypothetical protein [Anaerolineales bacterium]